MEEAEKVKVVVRCRPISSTEKSQGHKSAVTCSDEEKAVTVKNPSAQEPSRTFYFDAVFSPNTDQMTVYNTAARPIVENVLKGYNGTIFAYGQTGTGKTFTMAGELEPSEMRGIIPNSFAHIFDHIAKCKHDTTFLVRVSYLEIYNEEIRDLLSKDPSGNLEIRERPDVGVYVRNLSNPIVENASNMQSLMEYGNKNRKVGATAMNIESSRSHAMFTVTIESCRNQLVTQGKLQLVDLAGSERQSKTGAQGERLKEAAKINLSLSTLGNVISSLVDSKSSHIPYRNSKLTRLLQDSLGGNSKTVMIANIGPATYNYDETLSTLRYANRAKNIQNVAKINEDPKDAQLRKFQQEIEFLRKQLTEEGEVEGQEDVWEARMKDKEAEMALRKKMLEERAQAASVDDTETRDLVRNIMENEAELKNARSEHEKLRLKLQQMEKKLIVGGENLLEKVEEQAKMLEISNKEMESSRLSEQRLRNQLEEKTAYKVEIEERYSTLQEESAARTRKTRKVAAELRETRMELKDVEEEHQRQMEAMLEDIRQLKKELLLNMTIIDEYIPVKQVEIIEKYVSWSEEQGDWQLKAIAYTGNNMRQFAPPTKAEFSNNNQMPLFYSYRADLGASLTERRPKTRSGKKSRQSIKLQQLLT